MVRTSRWVVAVALVVGVAGCATRRPETLLPVAQVAPGIVWKIEPYDILKTRVYRQPELSTEVTVAQGGTAFFPGIGKMTVAGLTSDSLEAMLNVRYGSLIREPAVQVTMQRELTVYGQLRSPGIYTVDPGSTLLNLTARGGGQTGADAPVVTLETAMGQRFTLPREARLGTVEIHRQDAIVLTERSFFTRNASGLATMQIAVTVTSALIGLVSILTR